MRLWTHLKVFLVIVAGLVGLVYVNQLLIESDALSQAENHILSWIIFRSLVQVLWVSGVLGFWGRWPARQLFRYIAIVAAPFVALGVFSIALFPRFLPVIPLQSQQLIDPPFHILAQRTKQGLSPQNYIAIFGDSYAYGSGNYWGVKNSWKRAPYHSANLLAKALKKDVVTFGRPGRGSLGGFVLDPAKDLKGLGLSDPQVILLYFYEGNDLIDNLREQEERGLSLEKQGALSDLMQQELAKPPVVTKAGLPFRFIDLLGKKLISRWEKPIQKPLSQSEPPHSGSPNFERKPHVTQKPVSRFKTDSGIIQISESLQGPSVGFSESDLRLARKILKNALFWAKNRYQNSRIALVYIPSPASIYDFVSQVQLGNGLFSPQFLRDRSNRLRSQVHTDTTSLGIEWVDSTAPLRLAAKTSPLHGPTDWNHFNERGYEVLTGVILAQTFDSPLNVFP